METRQKIYKNINIKHFFFQTKHSFSVDEDRSPSLVTALAGVGNREYNPQGKKINHHSPW